MSHRADDATWLHGPGAARGTGRTRDTRLVEEDEEPLAINAWKIKIARVRESIPGFPIKNDIGQGGDDGGLEFIAQGSDPPGFGKVKRGQLRCDPEADDARNIFRSRTALLLLSAPEGLRLEAGMAVQVERADSDRKSVV